MLSTEGQQVLKMVLVRRCVFSYEVSPLISTGLVSWFVFLQLYDSQEIARNPWIQCRSMQIDWEQEEGGGDQWESAGIGKMDSSQWNSVGIREMYSSQWKLMGIGWNKKEFRIIQYGGRAKHLQNIQRETMAFEYINEEGYFLDIENLNPSDMDQMICFISMRFRLVRSQKVLIEVWCKSAVGRYFCTPFYRSWES